VWWTRRPIEEPEPPRKLAEMIDFLGWDRLIFATDYPHWDFDDPQYAVHRSRFPRRTSASLFRENARWCNGQCLRRLNQLVTFGMAA